MPPSLVRFLRGFLAGSLCGTLLLVLGFAAWFVAFITGLDKDGSTYGMSLVPIYVLNFGLGGGVLYMFKVDEVKDFKSLLAIRIAIRVLFAWMLAIAVVLTGCFYIASLVIGKEPIDWFIGARGAAALFAIMAVALILTRHRRA